MNNNYSYYGNSQQQPNNNKNPNFYPSQNNLQNPNNPQNPNNFQNFNSITPQFDPKFLNTPEFHYMMRLYFSQNPNISNMMMQPPQTTSNIGYQQPAQIHSQNLDQSPATPEAHGSSNKQQIEELYPTQQLGDNDFGSTQRKGKEKAKKTTKIGGPLRKIYVLFQVFLIVEVIY